MRGVSKGDEKKETFVLYRGSFMYKSRILLMWAVVLAFVFSFPTKGLPQERLNLWLDYASFQYQPEPGKSYVEIYYSLDRSQLDFFPQEEGYLAAVLSLQLFIEDLDGDTVECRRWEVASTIKGAAEREVSYKIIDILATDLSPGSYTLRLEIQDLNSKKKGLSETRLEVPDFSQKGFTLSQIELAYNADPETLATKFTKGARKIMPNPSGLFASRGQMLYFYAEAYNLSPGEGPENDYSLSFEVLDENGERFKDFGMQTLQKPGSSAVIISGINISTLPRGNYKLRITASDLLTSEIAQSTKDFKIWRKAKIAEESVFELLRDEKQVQEVRDQISYIATRAELKMWDDLNLEGKGKFLEEFWRKRDPEPATPENEFRLEHLRRWNYVNAKFAKHHGAGDGWQTDMGRVYLKYGEPDDIERHPLSLDSKPWEKWHYDEIDEGFAHPRQSGVLFVFVDEDGFGVYRLVHSTAVGEIQNLRWYDSITLESGFDR
jgi:GWxTD domain-containing protein